MQPTGHRLATPGIHCVHLMEFTPTPFRQTLHGCFTLPITCVIPIPIFDNWNDKFEMGAPAKRTCQVLIKNLRKLAVLRTLKCGASKVVTNDENMDLVAAAYVQSPRKLQCKSLSELQISCHSLGHIMTEIGLKSFCAQLLQALNDPYRQQQFSVSIPS